MSPKQIGYIVVRTDWYNAAGVNQLLGNGKESGGEGHVIMVGDPDLSDHRGVWVPGVTTDYILNRIDNSPTTMKFLIPWHYILGLGISDELSDAAIGFKGTVTAVGTQASN